MGDMLITGATGTIGQTLIKLLREARVPLRAFVREAERARQLLGPDVALVVGDLTDPAALDRALDQTDTLFLLSNNPSHELPAVAAAIRRGVQRIVKVSANGAYGEPPPAHRRVEEHIRRSGLRYTMLRPNAFMQTLVQYLPPLLDETGVFLLPGGDGRTAWVDTRDIAAVAAAVLQQPGHDGTVYQVTGPQALTMDDIAATLSALLARPIHYRDGDPALVREQMQQRGLGPMADFLVDHYLAVRQGAFAAVSDAVVQTTGAAPRSFAQFAAEHVAQWQRA